MSLKQDYFITEIINANKIIHRITFDKHQTKNHHKK